MPLEEQAQYPDELYPQLVGFMERAWLTILGDTEPAQSYLHILQGSLEPFTQFLAKLHESFRRQVSNTQAVDMSVL